MPEMRNEGRKSSDLLTFAFEKELYVAAASVSLHGIPERWELVLSVMEVSQENWL